MRITSRQLRSIILREARRSLREAGIAPSREEQDAINPPSRREPDDVLAAVEEMDPWEGDILMDSDVTELCQQIAHRLVKHAIDNGTDGNEAEMLAGNAFYTLTDAVEQAWRDMGGKQ